MKGYKKCIRNQHAFTSEHRRYKIIESTYVRSKILEVLFSKNIAEELTDLDFIEKVVSCTDLIGIRMLSRN